MTPVTWGVKGLSGIAESGSVERECPVIAPIPSLSGRGIDKVTTATADSLVDRNPDN
jgi:hypothetical protein